MNARRNDSALKNDGPSRTHQRRRTIKVLGLIMIFLLGIAGWRIWQAVRPPSLIRWNTLMGTGQQYQQDSRYRNAEQCYSQAIAEAKRLDPTHPRLADSYFALAELYYAERWHFNSDSPDSANPFPQVGEAFRQGPMGVLRALEKVGDTRHARRIAQDVTAIIACYRQAMHIHEQADGNNSPSLLPILKRMAALTALRDVAATQPFFLRIWRISVSAYGPDDARTHTAFETLLDLDCRLGRFAEAVRLCQHALSRSEANHGRTNIKILPELTALAQTYRRAKEYHRAEPLYLRGIAIAEHAYHLPYTSMTDPSLYGTPCWDEVFPLLDDYVWQLDATGRKAAARAMWMRLTD